MNAYEGGVVRSEVTCTVGHIRFFKYFKKAPCIVSSMHERALGIKNIGGIKFDEFL